jgi:RimJ/RimL family protein N-acetyltransferase
MFRPRRSPLRSLFSRRSSRILTWQNRRRADLLLWLEPWAEEFVVPPGSRLALIVSGKNVAAAELSLDVSDKHLVFYAPGGSCVTVLIDGEVQDSGSIEIAVPGSAGISSRNFVEAAFDDFPKTRLAGAPAHPIGAGLADPLTEGDLRLTPLGGAHRDALKAACAQDLDIWSIYSVSYDPAHFDLSFDLLLSHSNWRCFAIFFRDRLVGMSCFIGIDPERGVLEIGNTYYIPDMRGTGFNRRVKDLMLKRAFGCGFRRVEFRVDARNGRSQAALAKLGAVREGVLRADRITWTGHVRDTVLYSILAGEWPRRSGGR